MAKRPLTATEFVAPLARLDPIYKEEEEALKVSFVILKSKQNILYVVSNTEVAYIDYKRIKEYK